MRKAGNPSLPVEALLAALASIVVLVVSAAHKREVDAASMALRDGLAFVVVELDPFSGRAIERYDDGRVKALQSSIAR